MTQGQVDGLHGIPVQIAQLDRSGVEEFDQLVDPSLQAATGVVARPLDAGVALQVDGEVPVQGGGFHQSSQDRRLEVPPVEHRPGSTAAAWMVSQVAQEDRDIASSGLERGGHLTASGTDSSS